MLKRLEGLEDDQSALISPLGLKEAIDNAPAMDARVRKVADVQ